MPKEVLVDLRNQIDERTMLWHATALQQQSERALRYAEQLLKDLQQTVPTIHAPKTR
jgi:hypothetical protein